MKKRIITLDQLRKENPFLAGKVITALNRNRVKPKNTKKKNFKMDFSKEDLERYITLSILK